LWGVSSRFGNRGNRTHGDCESRSDEALLGFFQSHASLRDRLASIVGAVGNLDVDLAQAGAAEERLVEEMRLLGREALQGSYSITCWEWMVPVSAGNTGQ